MRIRWRFAAAGLALVVASGVTGLAHGQELDADDPFEGRGSWTLTPVTRGGASPRAHFLIEARPGETVEDTVALANLTDRPISFSIYAADAYNTETEGAFAVRGADEPKEDVAAWVRLGIDAYTVPPGKEVRIPFAIDVPENAEPGDHSGGIVALNINPEERAGDGDVGVDVLRAIGARIYLRVPGALDPALDLSHVGLAVDTPLFPLAGDGSATVTYEVYNPGNVRLTSTATIKLKGPFGWTVREVRDVELPELLPGNRTTVTQSWSGLPVTGRLTAEVTLDSEAGTVVRSASAWTVPWGLVAVILLLLALLVWRRRRRRAGPSAPAETPPTRDPELVHS